MTIKKGDKVKVDYEGRLDNGEIFDTSSHGDHSHPLEFEAGAGHVIKGFDDAVMGMNVGDEKEFHIKKEEAYGNHDSRLVQKVPKDSVPNSEKLKEGMILGMRTPEGQTIPVKVTKITDKEITFDMNHPLAGQNLTFKIKIVGIN